MKRISLFVPPRPQRHTAHQAGPGRAGHVPPHADPSPDHAVPRGYHDLDLRLAAASSQSEYGQRSGDQNLIANRPCVAVFERTTNAHQKQENQSGVLLEVLDPRSRLAYEGLTEGDIITGVNRQQVHNLVDFTEALELTRKSILLQIRRRGRAYIARIE